MAAYKTFETKQCTGSIEWVGKKIKVEMKQKATPFRRYAKTFAYEDDYTARAVYQRFVANPNEVVPGMRID